MEKKTKLTISGSAKKSIKNIELAKTQGNNSTLIEKKLNRSLNKGGSFRSSHSKSKNPPTFQRSVISKSSLIPKPSSGTSDFERRKLAEQRATKRIKGQEGNKNKKTLKIGEKKRETKLTVSRALSDEIEARERSLASVKRARLKES